MGCSVARAGKWGNECGSVRSRTLYIKGHFNLIFWCSPLLEIYSV